MKKKVRSADQIVKEWGVAKLEEVVELFDVYSSSIKEKSLEDQWESLYEVCKSENIDEEYEFYKGCMDENFCKILVRNWFYASQNNIDCKGKCSKGDQWKEMMPDAKCAILNVWLYYYETMIRLMTFENFYVNKAMDNLWEIMKDDEKCARCEYRTAKSALSASNMDEIRTVLEALKGKGVSEKMEQIPRNSRHGEQGGGCNFTYEEGKAKIKDQEVKLEEKDKKILEDIIQKKDVITKMKEEIEKEERQKTAVLPAPPSPPGSTNDNDRCKLFNEVKKTWFNKRQRFESKPQDVTQFWKDVDSHGEGLMEKIFKKNDEADQYCNDDNGKSGTLNEKEKAACKLVAGGLHHLYSIQLERGPTQNDPEENQKFQQMVGCMMINSLIKKLEEEEKSSCPVDEGIKQAFSKNDQIKNEACKNKRCDLCEKENYTKCKIDNQDVKNKLDAILQQNNDKITKALSTINTLCHRVQCVMTKWFANRKAENGATKTMNDMWNDVKHQLEIMSPNVSTNDTAADNLCGKDEWKDGFVTEKDREACRFINRSLKHIYGITIDQGDLTDGKVSENPEEKHRKAADNRMFKQTMLCAALNAYADILKENTKDKCPLDEEKIKKMFDKGNAKISEWCVNANGENNNCVTCERVENLICEVGDQGNRTKMEDKLKPLLKGDTEITKTLNTITTISNFCTRIACVSKKWGVNRDGITPTWENMQGDINGRAKEMFEHISNKNADMEAHCSGHSETTSRIVTDPERKACQYITSGLQYIYEIEIDKEDLKGNGVDKERKAKDNRDFKQTMACLLLNAYADRLEQVVKSPCTVSKKTIEQAFQKGNGKIKNWCKGKDVNGQNNNCEVCDRVKDLKNCTVGNENVKAKVDSMLQGNKDIEKTLSTISNLCDRAQCKDSWDDIKSRIDPLTETMSNADNSVDTLCHDVEQGAKKEACQQIVRGLKHIYEIKVEEKGEDGVKENNRLFKQTMACLILNEYGKLLMEKSCIDENTIKQAFNAGESLHTTECKSGKNECDQCNWDKCTNFKIGRNDIDRQKIKKELEKDGNTQNILSTNCTSPSKPAAVRPPAAASPQPLPAAPPSTPLRSDQDSTPKPGNKADSIQGDPGQKQEGKITSSSSNTLSRTECESGEATSIEKALACAEMSGSGNNLGDTHINSKDDEFGRGIWSVTQNAATTTVVQSTPTVISGPVGDTSQGTTGGPGTNGKDGQGVPQAPDAKDNAGEVPKKTVTEDDDSSGSGGTKQPPAIVDSQDSSVKDNVQHMGNDSTKNGPAETVTASAENDNGGIKGPKVDVSVPDVDISSTPLGGQSPPASSRTTHLGSGGSRGGKAADTSLPVPLPVINPINPSDFTSYLPLTPVLIGTSVISYLLWKYFTVEVLDECENGDTKLVQEDFLKIIVEEFMESEFMKEEKVLKEQVSIFDVPEEDFVPKEEVPSSDSGFCHNWNHKTMNYLTLEKTEKKNEIGEEKESRIWNGMKQMWDELINILRTTGADGMKELCDDKVGKGAGVEIRGPEKALCKAFFKIYYYMNGMPIKGMKQTIIQETNEEGIFLRCVVGMTTLHQIFGKHHCFDKYVDYVSYAMSGLRGMKDVPDHAALCAGMNFDGMKIGTKFVGATLAKWNEGQYNHVAEVGNIKIADKPSCKDANKGQGGTPVNSIQDKDKAQWLQKGNLEEMKNIVEKNQYVAEDKMGEVLKEFEEKIKEVKRRIWEQSGCPKLNADGFEEDEEVDIGEWFTEFFNHIASDSNYYNYHNVDAIKGVCDGLGGDDDKEIKEEDRKFCETLVKNLWIVSKCNSNSYDGEKCIKPKNSCYYVKPCDLLKIWLMYARGGCASKDVIEFVFTAFHEIEELIKGGEFYERCDLKKSISLYRGETDMLYTISNLMHNSPLLRKQMEARTTEWCRKMKRQINVGHWEGKTTNTDRGRSSVGGAGEDEEMRGILGNIGKKLEMNQKIQEEVQKAMDEVIQKHIPQTTSSIQLKSVSQQGTGACTPELQNRLDKMGREWHEIRGYRDGTTRVWDKFWGKEDTEKILQDLLEAMTNGSKLDNDPCKDFKEGDDATEGTNKKACQYIAKGLQHIYNIKLTKSATQQNPVQNQRFQQTMSCIILNELIRKLKEHKSCPINEGIKKAFEVGSKFRTSCKFADNTQCDECTEKDYSDCTVEQDNKKIGDQLKPMLQEKENEIQQTLRDINNLCQRVKCVAQKWVTNRTENGHAPNINGIWGDTKTELGKLSKSMIGTNAVTDNFCENSKGKKGKLNDKEKMACRFITRGLHHTYSIPENLDDDKKVKGRAKDNQLFKRTMSCVLLNAYADMLLQEKGKECSIDETKIEEMFQEGNNQKDTWCANKDGSSCDVCERVKDLGCTLGEAKVKEKVKPMLDTNEDIKKTLGDLCPPKSVVAKPVASGGENGKDQRKKADIDPGPAKSAPSATTGRNDNSAGDDDLLPGKPPQPAVPPGNLNNASTGKSNIIDTGYSVIVDGVELSFGDPLISSTGSGYEDDSTYDSGTWSVTENAAETTVIKSTPTVISGPSTSETGTAKMEKAAAPASDAAPASPARGPGGGSSAGAGDSGPPGSPGGPGAEPGGQGSGGGGSGASSSSSSSSSSGTPGSDGSVSGGEPDGQAPQAPVLPYFAVPIRRRRYRRAHHVSGPTSQEKLLDHVDDQADDPQEYTLVKERKQPRSIQTGRTKRQKKQGVDSRVCHRTIIDIHLEVLDECQNRDLHSTKDDFFEILVQEIMGSKFMEEKFVSKEEVPSSDSGFREEDFVPKEQVPSSDSGFRVGVPKEQVQS
ncbi:SICA antigen [Plasmodium coatneyi]|uniref:SICA antigen n=1 Tax=Plasmodium coatneyi TaxID=208452 RepID=A0A1B1E5R1_9APIC|nr:SICA antigen [Plasmodium coatneyi]ANQ10323.1 SICA antigen [Plasmodium coatneyi]